MSDEPRPYWEFAEINDRRWTDRSGVAGDVEFYRGLALEAGGLVVELGVGTGRIAIPTVQAGVERMLGLDLAEAMLAVARRKVAEAGVGERLTLEIGDMRDFTLPEPAALVTIPFRAFLHNLTTEDQLSTLAAAHRALGPGGRLALNVFNPSILMIAEWMQRGPDEWEELRGAIARHQYEPSAQRAHTVQRIRDADGVEHRESIELRYVHRFELEHLLVRSGFEIEALYGDHMGASFGETSTEIVVVARRA